MKDEIILHLNDARYLERIYRSDKIHFKDEFNKLYPDLRGNAAAEFWNERLNFAKEKVRAGTNDDILFVIIAVIIAAFIVKLPAIFNLNEEFFYTRNVGFIVFPLLTVYFAWKNNFTLSKIIPVTALYFTGLIFINVLPGDLKSDTLDLSCIHLVLFMWTLLAFSFTGEIKNQNDKRLGYLKYNGDLLVMTALILISGGILSAVTVGLFRLIGLDIHEFYFNNVAIIGLASAPIVGTYLTQTNPQLVGRVSPVIARIFSPLVLVMLISYLVAIMYSGKDPYNDREFLLIFNALLIGVMALIFFSVAETSRTEKSRWEIQVLMLLSIVTVLVNGIALSAIVFRIHEWGLTPNRAAVLGSNVLILINLLMATVQFIKLVSNKSEVSSVGKAITNYLPVYAAWSVVVTFLFPFIFGFK
jgi:hypothetical protein